MSLPHDCLCVAGSAADMDICIPPRLHVVGSSGLLCLATGCKLRVRAEIGCLVSVRVFPPSGKAQPPGISSHLNQRNRKGNHTSFQRYVLHLPELFGNLHIIPRTSPCKTRYFSLPHFQRTLDQRKCAFKIENARSAFSKHGVTFITL